MLLEKKADININSIGGRDSVKKNIIKRCNVLNINIAALSITLTMNDSINNGESKYKRNCLQHLKHYQRPNNDTANAIVNTNTITVGNTAGGTKTANNGINTIKITANPI
jgi:hypothetical protein